MENLNVEKLKQLGTIGYNDGDIIIVDNIREVENKDFRRSFVDMIGMIFCLKGKLTIKINGKQWNISQNNVLVCTPNVFVEDYSLSENFDCKIIGFSVKAIDSALYLSKNVWHNLYYIYQNPVIHLKANDMQIFTHYYYIAEAKLRTKNNIYHREIMHSLLSSLIYEFLSITDRYSLGITFSQDNNLRQGDIIFRKFVELLAKEKGMIRSVSDAADKLNVSGKYLSSVIKNSSGKNALEIIHHYTLQEVIRRLKYTDKTIQEISNDMNFPSMSFFGKFVKQQTGMSPKQLRKNGGITTELQN